MRRKKGKEQEHQRPYRIIKDKVGLQSRSNLAEHENDDLLADSLSYVLNANNVSVIRQAEIHVHIVEPLTSNPITFGLEISVEKLKS
jgi:hypothetical protein